MESLGSAQDDGSSVAADEGSNCEESVSTTLDLGGQVMFLRADSLVVVDTGAAANPVCCRRLAHRDEGTRRDAYWKEKGCLP